MESVVVAPAGGSVRNGPVTSYTAPGPNARCEAKYIRVPADWVVPLPEGSSPYECMVLGTAGFTAAQCVNAIQLNGVAHRFGAGNRMRIALSTSYWPIVWPSPRPAVLTLDLAGSSLSLPVRAARAEDALLPEFAPAEHAPPTDASPSQ